MDGIITERVFRSVFFIQEYIDKNIVENISIEIISEKIGISKFHFLKEFKKYFGIIPHQFILNKKIEKSKFFLKNSNKTLALIAYELNFNDQSHFSNTFKKIVGITPRKYRYSDKKI